MWRFASSAASAAVGASLAAIAFAAKGGTDLSTTTEVEVALLVGTGLAIALAVAWAPAPADLRAHGGLALTLFGVLTLVTALSMLWSISPDLSWIETSRVLAYLAVFAAAIGVGCLAPRGWTIVLRGVLIYAAVVCGYALASRVWPDALASNEIYARIGQPYGYWNAVGVTAAMGVIPAIWLGARRSGHAPANALSYPLLGIVLVALFLSYSRGSLIAAAIALAVWLAFVPLRLRSMGVLLVSGAAAAPVIAWALSKDAFTENGLPIQARESVAGDFGLLLLLMCAALLAAGLAIGFGLGRRAPSIVLRRRFGVAVVALACALPLALFSSAAFSDRGLTGTISDRFDDLTSETAKTSGGPERLTSSSSSRGRYWRQAGRIFDDRPVTGTGAGTFGMARLRHRNDQLVARHAHGYVAQVLADLGLLGLVTTLALAAAWLVAAARTTGARLRPGGLRWDAERVGVAALALTALVFGIQSTLDWTWFVPGTAVPALLAAGFVAGRGPLSALAGGGRDPATIEVASDPAQGDGRGVGPRTGWRPALRRPRRPGAGRLLAAVAVAGASLLCAWAAWQPERAERKLDDALALLESGKPAAAARLADEAHDVNPLAPKPLLVRASAEAAAGNRDAARRTLEQAVVEYPANAGVWLRLAELQLRLGQPAAALQTIRGALYLDPHSSLAQQAFFDARARLRGQAPPGTAPAAPEAPAP